MKTYLWTLCMLLCALSVASCSKDEEVDANVLVSRPFLYTFKITNEYLMTIKPHSSNKLFGGTEKEMPYTEIAFTHNGGEFSIDFDHHYYDSDPQNGVRYFVIDDASTKLSDLQMFRDISSYKRESYSGDFFTTSLSPDGHSITITLDKNNTLAERSFWVCVYQPPMWEYDEIGYLLHISQNWGTLEQSE